jgi:hypothetical protein
MTTAPQTSTASESARAALPNRAATVITALIAAAIGLIFLSGCSSIDIRKSLPWFDKEDEKFADPTKVVVMWSDAVMNQPDQKGIRGFGGRLYFYGKDPKDTIKVKGTLVIYAFDEASREANNVVPDKKFVFTADQLPKHCSVNAVGPSYSIWVPWDEVGGMRKEISLIARFATEKGAMVVSEQSKVTLPGTPPPEKKPQDLPAALESLGIKAPTPIPPLNTPPKPQFPGQQVSYEQPVAANSAPAESGAAGAPAANHKTVTIPVPSSRMSWLRQNAVDQNPVDQNTMQSAAQNPQVAAALKSGAVGGIGTRGAEPSAPSSSQSNSDARFSGTRAAAAPSVSGMIVPQGINAPPFNPGTQARATPGPTAAFNAPVGFGGTANPIGTPGVGSNPAAYWNSPSFGAGAFAANPMGSSMPAQGVPPSQTMPAMKPAGSGSWNNPAAFSAPEQTLMAPATQSSSSSF